MKHLIIIALCISKLAFSHEGVSDTFVFGDKSYLLNRLKQSYTSNVECFPFSIFQVKYNSIGTERDYYSPDNCFCPPSIKLEENSNGDFNGHYICQGNIGSYRKLNSVIDSLTISLEKYKGEIMLKEGNQSYSEFMIQTRLISVNEVRYVSLKVDKYSNLFSLIKGEVIQNPAIKLIVIDQIYYYDSSKQLCILPFKIMFNPI